MGTIVLIGGSVLVCVLFGWIASSSAAVPEVRTGLTVGPTATFVMPGLAIRGDRALSLRFVGVTEVIAQSVGTAGKVGLRVGLDTRLKTTEEWGLSGWFAGPRLGLWTLVESAGPTVGTDVQAIAGRRFVTQSRMFGSVGIGANYRSVLSGDSSQGRRLLPTLEFRLGGAR